MCAVPLVPQDSNHTLNDTRLSSLLQPPPLGLDLSAQGNDVAPRMPAVQDHGKEKTEVVEDERAWTTVVDPPGQSVNFLSRLLRKSPKAGG